MRTEQFLTKMELVNKGNPNYIIKNEGVYISLYDLGISLNPTDDNNGNGCSYYLDYKNAIDIFRAYCDQCEDNNTCDEFKNLENRINSLAPTFSNKKKRKNEVQKWETMDLIPSWVICKILLNSLEWKDKGDGCVVFGEANEIKDGVYNEYKQKGTTERTKNINRLLRKQLAPFEKNTKFSKVSKGSKLPKLPKENKTIKNLLKNVNEIELSKTIIDMVDNKNIEKEKTLDIPKGRILSSKKLLIKRFGNESSFGTIFKITNNEDNYSFIAKVQNCGPEYEDEVKFLKRATKKNLLNYPYIYGTYNKDNHCIFYMKLENGTVNELFFEDNKHKNKDKENILKQCYVTIYLLHNNLNMFHCDMSPENMLYSDSKKNPECLEYIIDGKNIIIKNEGIIIIPFDFGNSIQNDSSFAGCNSPYYDYNFFTSSILEKIENKNSYEDLKGKIEEIIKIITEEEEEEKDNEFEMLQKILKELGGSSIRL